MLQENSENHQNIKITLESYETHENLRFPVRIFFERKTKIIEILEVHARSTNIKQKNRIP